MIKRHFMVLCVSALFLTAFSSCSEENLDDENVQEEPVQIDKNKYRPS